MDMTQYTGLNELLAWDKEAQQYFNCLPEKVQGYLWQRAENIGSVNAMREVIVDMQQNGIC